MSNPQSVQSPGTELFHSPIFPPSQTTLYHSSSSLVQACHLPVTPVDNSLMDRETPLPAPYLTQMTHLIVRFDTLIAEKCIANPYFKCSLSGFHHRTAVSSPASDPSASPSLGYRYKWNQNEMYLFTLSMHAQLFDSLHVELWSRKRWSKDVVVASISLRLSELELKNRKTRVAIEMSPTTSPPNSGSIVMQCSIEMKNADEVAKKSEPVSKAKGNEKAKERSSAGFSFRKLFSSSPSPSSSSSSSSSSASASTSGKSSKTPSPPTPKAELESRFDHLISAVPVALPLWLYPLRVFLDAASIEALNAVFRLSCTLGHGIHVSHPMLLASFYLIFRYYSQSKIESRSLPFATHDPKPIDDQALVEEFLYYHRYSISIYGWKGLYFFGKRDKQLFLRDSLNPKDLDKKCILEYLKIDDSDLLEMALGESNSYTEVAKAGADTEAETKTKTKTETESEIEIETESESYYCPKYLMFKDPLRSTLVLVFRGSLSAEDWTTSLTAHYTDYRGEGYIHSGFLSCARKILTRVMPRALQIAKEAGYTRILLTGHSLGGAVAATTKLLFEDHFPNWTQESGMSLQVIAFACPAIISKSLLRGRFSATKGLHAVAFGNDVVVRASYGSIFDFIPLLKTASQYAKYTHFLNVMMTALMRISFSSFMLLVLTSHPHHVV